MKTESFCLVLSGGGSKGIYHIGVWRALRELGIRVDGFVGSSIGAIVSAFLAQGEDETLEAIGEKIGLDFIVEIPDDLVKDGELDLSFRKRRSFLRFYRSAVLNRGLDTTPLRKLLETHIDEEKIRRRGKDLGVVAFNTTEMKSEEIYLDEMEPGKLIDYVMASSTALGFSRPKIAGRRYFDGGVYDNIPFAMAKRRGYRSIIVADVSSIGVNRRPDIAGVKTVYIKNSANLGTSIDFSRSFLDRFSQLGYLDTMRAFGKFRGQRYFIKPQAGMETRFAAFLGDSPWREKLFDRAVGGRKRQELSSVGDAMRRLVPKSVRHQRIWLPVLADCAAKILSLELVRAWSYSELFETITRRAREIGDAVDLLKEMDRRGTERGLRRELRERRLLKAPYRYHLLADRYLSKKIQVPLNRLLAEIYPELPAGVFFLDLLDDFRRAAD